jgi:hypothetical protein
LRRAPDAQLAVVVSAPALDGTSRHDDARVVVVPRGEGGGEDAWCMWTGSIGIVTVGPAGPHSYM